MKVGYISYGQDGQDSKWPLFKSTVLGSCPITACRLLQDGFLQTRLLQKILADLPKNRYPWFTVYQKHRFSVSVKPV